MAYGLMTADFSCLMSSSGAMSEQEYRGPQASWTAAFRLEFTVFSFKESQDLKDFSSTWKNTNTVPSKNIYCHSEVWQKQGEVS